MEPGSIFQMRRKEAVDKQSASSKDGFEPPPPPANNEVDKEEWVNDWSVQKEQRIQNTTKRRL